jgi:hypothetical protein
MGTWGFVAWLFALPLGGEIRAQPFYGQGIDNVAELLLKDVPHPALATLPGRINPQVGLDWQITSVRGPTAGLFQ